MAGRSLKRSCPSTCLTRAKRDTGPGWEAAQAAAPQPSWSGAVPPGLKPQVPASGEKAARGAQAPPAPRDQVVPLQ